jgi:hypothetical protein
MKSQFYIFLLLLFCLNALASFPENNLSRPMEDNKNTRDDKRIFDQVLDEIASLYTKKIESFGAKFEIVRAWEDDKVNASARKQGMSWAVKVYGGLFRFELMNPDSFAMVVCHEIGHLIGGAPTWKPQNKSSSEGQADYFSTLSCMKNYLKNKNNFNYLKDKNIPLFVNNKCRKVYGTNEAKNLICKRQALAAKILGDTYVFLSSGKTAVNFETPDPYTRMFILFNGYPKPQCRLDTLLSGLLCDKDPHTKYEQNLYNLGNCNLENQDTYGLRPKCWYVPRAEDE